MIWGAMSSAAVIHWRGMWGAPTMSYEKGWRAKGISLLLPRGLTAQRQKLQLGRVSRRNVTAWTAGFGVDIHAPIWHCIIMPGA